MPETTTRSTRELRSEFFRYLYSDRQGWIVIGSDYAVRGDFKHKWFQWPLEEAKLLTHIQQINGKREVWFGVNLYRQKDRKKVSALPGNLLWADLDIVDPDSVEPPPQLVLASSPGRFQGIWVLDEDLPEEVAEDYSRRIYEAYKVDPATGEKGVDSGWARNKLLRVPYTLNLKYPDTPQVEIVRAKTQKISTEAFDHLTYSKFASNGDLEEDAAIPELGDPEEIIAKYAGKLRERNFAAIWTYEPKPEDDWSAKLWNLIMVCLEAGMEPEEVYTVANYSKVNKYERDGRPARYLWRDVQKASNQKQKLEIITNAVTFDMPELIPGEEYKLGHRTFVEDYIAWGKEATDAPTQYHELSAYMLLSSLLSGSVKMETSFGDIRPNLWGLILGDSTYTRKTTAARMAVNVIDFVDRNILLATDGSAEGIITGLQGRPSSTSLFYRDEIVGLFDSMKKKDYQAGLAQLFTQLYDGSPVYRLLRKETISVSEPIFLFFGAGIKEQFFVACDEGFIYSGFLPRFLIVSGHTVRQNLRKIGPPTPELTEKKTKIYEKAHHLYHAYLLKTEVQILGQSDEAPIDTVATMNKDAFKLFGEMEDRLIDAAYRSPNEGLALPTFERLHMSLLKMAILNAAARQEPEEFQIEVTEKDILRATKYVQDWGRHTIEVLLNVGQTVANRQVDRVHRYIIDHPECSRSQVSRALNLGKREMVEIEETLEMRGHILVKAVGRGRTYTTVG